ncbi:MAG: alpha/beta fold hydrolase [Acidimicrobiia bacterium]|nr:alpha/beta fold hydrolase [Acidimicrobiia bacterium]
MNIITAPFWFLSKALKAAPWAMAAGIAYSSKFVDHNLPLPDPVATAPDFAQIPGRDRVALYRRGRDEAQAVLLVHSVNAAASAAEMRPLFDRLSTDFAVAALDLPGYGKSDRSPIEYTVDHMTAGVVAALEDIGRPTHVVALSLGSEFAARAETLRPDLVASLTLLSPTGFGGSDSAPPEKLGDILRTPVIGQAIYDGLTTRLSIDYFLAKSFVGDVDPALSSYGYLTAHQPNARFAPAAFLSGKLFTRRPTETLYRNVKAPTLVLFDEDNYSSFDELAPFTSRHEAWTAQRIEGTKGLPHFDKPEETVEAIIDFISSLDS